MIPDLSPAELERLALLMEEMGESIQAIGKIMRHGYESRHPDGGPTNRELLEKEIGHVNVAVRMMVDSEDLWQTRIQGHEFKKVGSVGQYLHHQGGK
ncbi:MAG TPA: hypothetical protein PK416_03045 [Thermodesulfobacteriota bacterium]|nr:hypothetical protein [Thermodesulfobacteriota bacterium]